MRPDTLQPQSDSRTTPQERSLPPSMAAGEAAATGVAQPPASSDRPRPLAPLKGAYVDASAALFEWGGVPGATGYRLQIGQSPAFERDVLEVDAGQTTSLTLHGTLPERDVELFWRIRAEESGGEGTWSGYGRFVATGDDAVAAYRSERDLERAEAAKEAARRREARAADLDLIPHHEREQSVTTTGEAGTLLLMLVTFVLTVWLLFALT